MHSVQVSESVKINGAVSVRQKVSDYGNADDNAAGTGERKAIKDKTTENLDSAVSNLNDYAQQLKRELRFSIDDNSGRTVITVTDPETEEVIRQIPPEEVLRIAESLEDNSGVLLSAQV